MGHQETAASGCFVNCMICNFNAREFQAFILTSGFIVIAGYIQNANTLASHLDETLDHLAVLGRPIPSRFQAPQIDDIADQIEGLTFDAIEESNQVAGLTAAAAKVDVADPNCAIAQFHVIPALWSCADAFVLSTCSIRAT
jgi:hypothetical protein